MTRTGFDRSLTGLEQHLLEMGSIAEEAVAKAVTSLVEQNLALARTICENDEQIDQMSRDIEDECIKILALQQPIARDLRAVTTVLRTVVDLERIADHAVNLAELTLRIGSEPLIKPLIDIPRMARLATDLLHDMLQAYVNRNIEKAHVLCRSDEEIDTIYAELYDELIGFVMVGGDPKRAAQAVILLFAARYLERVADHAVNIGERLIYLETGQVVHY